MANLLNFDKQDILFTNFPNEEKKTLAITPEEGMHLAYLASQVREDGSIVEIGSYQGRSVGAIALGCVKAGIKPQIFAIDIWTSGRGKTFANYTRPIVFKNFKNRMKALGVDNMVHPIKGASVEVAARRKRPIDMLHIDANHEYEFVLEDFKAWSRFLRPGAIVAFHDYSEHFPGVMKAVKEMVIDRPDVYENHEIVGRLFSARLRG